MAEGVGFEPTRGISPPKRLAGARTRPLCDPSNGMLSIYQRLGSRCKPKHVRGSVDLPAVVGHRPLDSRLRGNDVRGCGNDIDGHGNDVGPVQTQAMCGVLSICRRGLATDHWIPAFAGMT